MIQAIILFIIWSSVYILGKMAMTFSPPLLLTSARTILAGAIMLLYVIWKDYKKIFVTKKQLLIIAIIGIFCVYIATALEYYGLKYVSAGKTSLIFGLSPFFAALFAYIHFKEKMNKRKWLGLCIGFLGVIPVLFVNSDSENLTRNFLGVTFAEIAIILATMLFVYGYVLIRKLLKESNLSPIVINGLSMFIGGVVALIHSFFAENWDPFPIAATNIPSFIYAVLLVTIISNLICANAYGYLLKKYTNTFLSFVSLLSPFFASFYEWTILKRPPSLITLGSSLIIFFGLWIVYNEEKKLGYIEKINHKLT